MRSGSLTPSEIAISRKFPASPNDAMMQSQPKAMLAVAGIGTMKGIAVQEENCDASVVLEDKNAVLFS